MSTENNKKIIRAHVSELPLLKSIAEKIGLRNILDEFFPKKKNEVVSPADTLMLLIYNLARGKNPLYQLEEWTRSIDKRSLGYEKYKDIRFTDDRFGSALDDLYAADRATLMTRIVVEAVNQFNINLTQIHNDSTSVSAHGEYTGKTSTGFELLRGKSKDHTSHLKQLIFCLSISADGAVPVHYKSYPGNRNDDTTHIETWDSLAKISPKSDFLYVGDCKLCTDRQLSHIVSKGGRAITTIPENWSEIVDFKNRQREIPTAKKEIWKKHNEEKGKTICFSAYSEICKTKIRGYTIHWIHNSSKREDDYRYRENELDKAVAELEELSKKLNKRKLTTEDNIRNAYEAILKRREALRFIEVVLTQTKKTQLVKSGRGRPRKDIKHSEIEKTVFTISWTKNEKAILAEENVDGIYPLLSTDPGLSALEVIKAYKYQPKLEKRFTQLKSIQNIAPLLFKKLERIEANMFLFFIALMLQSLIEREIRSKMKARGLKALEVYPEMRDSPHPTTTKVFDIFDDVFTYKIIRGEDILEEYNDDLTEIQKSILEFLSIDEDRYWSGINKKALHV